MADCNTTVKIIHHGDNIGSSLTTINDNFNALHTLACNIENQLNKEINVRTFFYYGPNSATKPNDSMDGGAASKPSATTIETFVNDSSLLNVPAISDTNDIVYVIYQKTGWQTQLKTANRSGSGEIPYTRQEPYTVTRQIGIRGGKEHYSVSDTYYKSVTYHANYSWSTTINDTYKYHSPTFVIYKLTYNGTRYTMNTDFPKYTSAITNSTIDWNNPANWSIY